MGDPHKCILDRDLASAVIREYFADVLVALEDVIDYGTHLVPRCFHSSPRLLTDVILIPVLLKRCVAAADAVHIASQHSSVLAARLALRTLYEADLYLRFIDKESSDERAKAYYVYGIRQELELAREALLNPTEFEGIYSQQELESEAQRCQAILDSEEFTALNDSFDRARGRSTRDRHWAAPLGCGNIFKMASQVKAEVEYRGIYSTLSEHIHRESVRDAVDLRPNEVWFLSCRTPIGLDNVIKTAVVTLIGTYRHCLARYRNEELDGQPWKNRAKKWFEAVKNAPQVSREMEGFTIRYPLTRE